MRLSRRRFLQGGLAAGAPIRVHGERLVPAGDLVRADRLLLPPADEATLLRAREVAGRREAETDRTLREL